MLGLISVFGASDKDHIVRICYGGLFCFCVRVR